MPALMNQIPVKNHSLIRIGKYSLYVKPMKDMFGWRKGDDSFVAYHCCLPRP
jgi:hypothetical protein